jgi:hypothetical protein
MCETILKCHKNPNVFTKLIVDRINTIIDNEITFLNTTLCSLIIPLQWARMFYANTSQ